MRQSFVLRNVANLSESSILRNKGSKHMSSRKETNIKSTYVKYVEPLRFKYCSQTSMSLSVG